MINNIKLINVFKKKYKSVYPVLSWQFVVMGHNEHELPLARKMARNLNMLFFPKLNCDPEYSPIKNTEFVKKVAGMSAASREEYQNKYNKFYLLPCIQLWLSPQINWDGKLMGCCINRWQDFGNVFEKGFETCITGEKFVFLKKMLLGEVKPRDDIPCKKCLQYKDILENPLTKKDIFFRQV